NGTRAVTSRVLGSRADNPDSGPAAEPRIDPALQGGAPESLSEGSESVPGMFTAGWAVDNNSQPLGAANWTQGVTALGPAHSGAATSYAVVNFNSAADPAPSTISNWLLTPEMVLQDGTELTFWARASDAGF